jgi:UDP-N-acetylmuramoyl-L-alanyl-D-glutamate--2,6-diaminopimelate ligase
MKSFLKEIMPRWIFSLYYYSIALFAAFIYGFPSRKMVIIGVTGTKGKTSTSNFIWSCLSASVIKTGIITSANIRIGEKEIINPYHMTMPGRFIIQRFLFLMKKAGCTHCVVETTSEGLKQFRNVGIDYDIAVFTNLTPEHLPSHNGSFEEYKKMKGKLFRLLLKQRRKTIAGKKVKTVIIANYDSPHMGYFLAFPADRKITYGFNEGADYRSEFIKADVHGVEFSVRQKTPTSLTDRSLTKTEENQNSKIFNLAIMGSFNAYNALPAIVISHLFGANDQQINEGLKRLKSIPGRMEIIVHEFAKKNGFTVLVDYAHEQASMNAVVSASNEIKSKGTNTIVLLGAQGGGRDKTKRFLMGEVVGKYCDYVVVTSDDSYDDNPKEIIEDIARSAEKEGKVRDKNLFTILDRREGIRKALSLAKKGDAVLITGKGAEQKMMVAQGKSIPWDDRDVVREVLGGM